MGLQPQIEAFAQVHGRSPEAHPFLKGLKMLLKRQLSDPLVLQWCFPEEVLFRRDDVFLEDVVALLAQTLEHVPVSVLPSSVTTDGEVDATSRLTWEVAAHTSDQHLRSFCERLPDEASLEGDPCGDVLRSDRPRTNIGGELDQDNECALRKLLRCRCNVQ